MSSSAPHPAPPVRVAAGALAASVLGSIVFALAVALQWGAQAQGAGALVAFAGIAVALIVWSERVLAQEQVVDHREPVSADRSLPDREALARSRLLLGAMTAALGALGIALLFPLRAFAPAFGAGLYHTRWRRGTRAVRSDGVPIVAATIAVGSVVTVYPEGHTDDPDSATLLIRLPFGALVPDASRAGWSPQGCIAFSKICTHAGCPVGVYRQTAQQLLCPCHQSVFDVLRAARPVSGPASRPLPQLPLLIGDDGFVRAASDYQEPVGPGFWQPS
jgi:ubiquinol-cytochrome c reductase iron-sulfur subunit